MNRNESWQWDIEPYGSKQRDNDGWWWLAVMTVLVFCFCYRGFSKRQHDYGKYDYKIESSVEPIRGAVSDWFKGFVAKNKREKLQCAYIQRWLVTAQREYDRYNVPISISLAQGILESESGTSKVCKRTNNNFGVMDGKKYRVYDTEWESWRDHSLVLDKPLYKSLKGMDYLGWAKGLERLGYAEDVQYAEKLIAVIERWELDKWD